MDHMDQMFDYNAWRESYLFSFISGVTHDLEVFGGTSIWNPVDQLHGRGKERQVRRLPHQGQGTPWLQGELKWIFASENEFGPY